MGVKRIAVKILTWTPKVLKCERMPVKVAESMNVIMWKNKIIF
jgi:hypothetical protein